jgi:hypothetical protein
MKMLFPILLVVLLYVPDSFGQVEIVYLESEPKDKEKLTYCKLESNDYLERVEALKVIMENRLKEVGKEKNAIKVEIFIIEEFNGDMPTESQIGKRSFIRFYFIFK